MIDTKGKYILDVCCGSRMFWFDRHQENTIYMDIRELHNTLCDGRSLDVEPDIIGDFRDIPFEDNLFSMVVFDPPHLVQGGDNSWLVKKYGRLEKQTYKDDITKGFLECMRVLKPQGSLIMKWNEEQIPMREILDFLPQKPLFGDRRGKTHWLTFMKLGQQNV